MSVATEIAAGAGVYLGAPQVPANPMKIDFVWYGPPASHSEPFSFFDSSMFTPSSDRVSPFQLFGPSEFHSVQQIAHHAVVPTRDVPALSEPPQLDPEAQESLNQLGREHQARELLQAAREAEADPTSYNILRRFEESVLGAAVEALGGSRSIGFAIRDEADLLRAVNLGFPAAVLASLRKVGFRAEELERIIAPRRTLARRKASDQRLTRGESDSAWRLAHALALAAHVLKGPEAAAAWLRRPKAALGNQAPLDLIETAIGARAVERLLRQLEWGNVA